MLFRSITDYIFPTIVRGIEEELTSSGNPEGDTDVAAFEKQVAEELGMPAELTFRYRSPYFKHIFGSDGYASVHQKEMNLC